MHITIVGAGMGDVSLLTEEARDAIVAAELILASDRLYEQVKPLSTVVEECSFTAFMERVAMEKSDLGCKKIVLLVSGDVGFYSAATMLVKQFQTWTGMTLSLVNGINCLQYFCSRIQQPYEDVVTVSAHGRDTNLLPYVCYNKKVFALTGGQQKAENILASLDKAGMGHVEVYVGECLSHPEERILHGTIAELATHTFESLCVLFFLHPEAANCFMPLKDEDFIRGKVPMSKYAVRTVSVQSLAIQPTDIVYDIGAGTGSVAIEAARKAHKGIVYAIERHENACQLIEENRQRLGAYNVSVIHGIAPEALAHLPKPSCVFVGGSSGNMQEIVAAILEKNPSVRFCINAITLETLAEGKAIFESIGGGYEIFSLQVARSDQVGRYHMMRGENPVYIMTTGSENR